MTVAGSLCVADGYPVRFQGHEIVAFRGAATSSKEVHLDLDHPWNSSRNFLSTMGDGTFGVGYRDQDYYVRLTLIVTC